MIASGKTFAIWIRSGEQRPGVGKGRQLSQSKGGEVGELSTGTGRTVRWEGSERRAV